MPRAFTFRYEQYLKLKEKIEQDKALEFSAAVSVLQKQENDLHTLEDRKLLHMMMESALGSSDLQRLKASANYLIQINEDIKKQYAKIKAQKKAVEERRAVLNEAVKERKIIEKLKEKQLEAYKRELRKKEIITEGETALQMSREMQ